jgi:hypothetical protein
MCIRICLFIACLFACVSISVAQSCDWGPGWNTIPNDEDVSWSTESCPDGYIVHGTLTVPSNSSLTIVAGVEVQYADENSTIVVAGQLSATGFAGLPVLFGGSTHLFPWRHVLHMPRSGETFQSQQIINDSQLC